MIKPPHLQPGDKVALVTPSHSITPDQLSRAIEQVSSLGLTVAYQPKFRQYGYFAGTCQERVNELHQAWKDPTIRAIFAVRGGSGAMNLLPHLDYSLIRQHPKILMGLSDISALLIGIYEKTRLITYHGPVACQAWSAFTREQIKASLFCQAPQKLTIPENTCITTLNPGNAQGKLIASNLAVLTAMIGSDYLPKDWHNTLLLIEDIDEEYYRLDRMLSQLALAGILQHISGLIFGQFSHCHCNTQGKFTLIDIFQRHVAPLNIPAIMGASFGHEDTQWVIPIGRQATLNTAKPIPLVVSPDSCSFY